MRDSSPRSKVESGDLGFTAKLDSSTQPMAYGNWIGSVIYGQIDQGDFKVTAAGISANGQIYLLQMLAPREWAWETPQFLAEFGRSLTFANPTKAIQSQSGSTSATGCSGCFGIGMEHMQNMTSIP